MGPETVHPPVWLNVTAAIIVFGIIGAIAYFIHQHRKKGIRKVADEFGLIYEEEGLTGISLPENCLIRSIFSFWGEPEVGRGLEGKLNGRDVYLFEVNWMQETLTHRGGYGYPLNVVALKISDLKVPNFVLRPERLRQKFTTIIGGQDIDFDHAPKFSRLYRLQGEDEAAIRAFFLPEIHEFFEQHPRRMVEGIEGFLFYFAPPRLIRLIGFRPKLLRKLLTEALEFIALISLSR